MTRTEKLVATITKLEKELAESSVRRKELEKNLAEVYNADGDTSAAHERLTAFKALIADKIGVLRSLDKQLKETSSAERNEVENAILKEVSGKREKAINALLKPAEAVETALAGHIGREAAETVHRQVADLVEQNIEEYLHTWAAREKEARMPVLYRDIPKRDDRGRVTYELMGVAFFQDFRFHRTRKLAPQHNPVLAAEGPVRGCRNLFAEEDAAL